MLLRDASAPTTRPVSGSRARSAAPSPGHAKRGPLAPRPRLGAAPALSLVAAAGLALVALGNDAARESARGAEPLFWGGLVVIYAPIAFRLLSVRASRAERISLAVLLGLSLFVVKILASPAGFVRFDELGTWRATNDVLQTGHLFSANPMIVSTAGFPGLETVTAAMAKLTGLSIFHSGLIVLGVARTILVLAMFLFVERATGSARAGGIGVAVYACNPSFLYFDAQFAYESLALPIAICMLLVAVRWCEAPEARSRRVAGGLVGALAILAATVTVTHHMTSYALIAFLASWAILTALAERRAGAGGAAMPAVGASSGSAGLAVRRSALDGPALPALLLTVMAGLWFAFVAGAVTVDELGKVVTGAADSTLGLIFGGSGPKTLFAGGGETNPFAARALAVGSVVPMLVLIPLGLRRTWRAPDSSALWRTLALAAMLYPVSLGLRLTLAGSETSQRASEFVFVGVAFFAGLLISEWRWPQGWLSRNARALALTAAALVVFLGGFIIGELPATRQPGPFLVGAEDRSISAQGLAAARFAADELPDHSRILADRSNATLIDAYGGLNPVFGQIHGVPVARVFLSKDFDRTDRRVIRNDLIDYILVDRRLTRELPVLGYYFEADEPGAFVRKNPIPIASLAKFRHAYGLSKIYVNGPITIYSTAGVYPSPGGRSR